MLFARGRRNAFDAELVGVGGDLGIDWFELRGTLGYLIPAIGECSLTGVSCLSFSSGGVGSSGSVLSNEVSDAADVTLTARGGYVGFVTVIAVGTALRLWISSSMGVGESGERYESASGLA